MSNKQPPQDSFQPPPAPHLPPLQEDAVAPDDIRQMLLDIDHDTPPGPFSTAARLNTLQSLVFCSIAEELEALNNETENMSDLLRHIVEQLEILTKKVGKINADY